MIRMQTAPTRVLLAVLLTPLCAPPLFAEVKLPGLFTDSMVLQRDLPCPVYGTADPGEKVAVTFGGQTKTATADAKGNWLVKLDALPASAEPRVLTVRSENQGREFNNVGGGLIAEEVDLDGNHLAAGTLKGFTVCGEDKKFRWADAALEGNTVVVSNPEVNKPVAVRYAWADFPLCNLYNKEGLPAGPFRTDDFRYGLGTTVDGIAVGKPFVCTQPITNGLFGGLTDGSVKDTNQNSFATNGAMKFPKEVTVDLQGVFTVTAICVHNSARGGTKTVEVQVSGDGQRFTTVGRTEFKNYTSDTYGLTGLNAKGSGFVRLVLPDVHELSFQHKPNGFIFLRELEVQGTPER
ncbi:MAG: hypothetical protein COY42_27620 [Armatimonadetes bacterium CG_4_10_14_0_8_um_filter_66_14]|nr:MAG: hypothetical protein AUJ96_06540 [Armatimonadetes bacterium CG2_30_66_41]PIZ34966.1 MAG: hypothetical protein COY42_27620 [Armatimonadetes bacterium CG_4_10_14_0_8_um_filter_66_14]